MTKADIVAKISEKLGLEKGDVQATVETFMNEVKTSLNRMFLIDDCQPADFPFPNQASDMPRYRAPDF